MKVAFILTGEAKHVGSTLSTMKSRIFDKVNCDVFMFTNRRIRGDLIKAIDKHDIHYKSLIIEEDRDLKLDGDAFRDLKEREDNKDVPFWTRYMRQIYGVYRGFNYVFKWFPKYDWYVRCRFDMSFLTDLDDLEKLDKDCLYIPPYPEVDDWYYDRFGFGGYKVMKVYANRWKTVRGLELPKGEQVRSPEAELAHTMKEHGIERRFCECDTKRCGQKH